MQMKRQSLRMWRFSLNPLKVRFSKIIIHCSLKFSDPKNLIAILGGRAISADLGTHKCAMKFSSIHPKASPRIEAWLSGTKQIRVGNDFKWASFHQFTKIKQLLRFKIVYNLLQFPYTEQVYDVKDQKGNVLKEFAASVLASEWTL